MTADDIIAALHVRHPPRDWAFFPELRIGTGYKRYRSSDEPWEQRIDLWVMCYYPSRNLEKIAYEIKISHADFKRELQHPEKRRAAMAVSNRFYFVAPEGILREAEMPPYCGLLEVRGGGSFRIARSAPWRKCADPPWRFVASLARRIIRDNG